MIGRYTCNAHLVSVYYGEVDCGSKIMRVGGRKGGCCSYMLQKLTILCYRPNVLKVLVDMKRSGAVFSASI